MRDATYLLTRVYSWYSVAPSLFLQADRQKERKAITLSHADEDIEKM